MKRAKKELDKRKYGYLNQYDTCHVCGVATNEWIEVSDGRGEVALMSCHKKCQRESPYLRSR